MAGIYIHIPFCKKACHYCDFHFSTNQKLKAEMIAAMKIEISIRKDFLGAEGVNTLYFGGGTPSLLSKKELAVLIHSIRETFEVAMDAEVTLEANPDDVSSERVKEWKELGINRISLGIQSFLQDDLIWMNRSHNADQAKNSITIIQDSGIDNISADLIYGYPLLSDKKWDQNLHALIDLNIPHMSCYSMTVETNTALAYQIQKGISGNMNEDQAANQFIFMQSFLEKSGFEHYEISNFSKPGMNSIHNTSYWKGEKYLGIGPSAHSYLDNKRLANIANNSKYIEAIKNGQVFNTTEILNERERLNEFIMINLRTHWGLNLNTVSKKFGNHYKKLIKGKILKFTNDKLVSMNDEVLYLTKKGMLIADFITSELFL